MDDAHCKNPPDQIESKAGDIDTTGTARNSEGGTILCTENSPAATVVTEESSPSLGSTPTVSTGVEFTAATETNGICPLESNSVDAVCNTKSNDRSENTESFAGLAPRHDDDVNLSVTSVLLQLPGDALHSIASFVSPADWRAMSRTSRASRAACQGVFTRVRMHGFRCATEVVLAWVSVSQGGSL